MSSNLILSNMTTIVNGMGEVGSFWIRQLSSKMNISEDLIWDALRAEKAQGNIDFDSNYGTYKPLNGQSNMALQTSLSRLADKGFAAHQAGWAKCVINHVRMQSLGLRMAA